MLPENLKKHTLTIFKVGIDVGCSCDPGFSISFINRAAHQHHKYFIYIFRHQKQISLDGTSEVFNLLRLLQAILTWTRYNGI
jgi:hypothetical protein